MSLSRQMIDAVVMAITVVGLPWARAAIRPPKTIQTRLRRREMTDVYPPSARETGKPYTGSARTDCRATQNARRRMSGGND